MKKVFYFILAAIAAISITACAKNETPSADISESGGLSVELLSENLTTDILDSTMVLFVFIGYLISGIFIYFAKISR